LRECPLVGVRLLYCSSKFFDLGPEDEAEVKALKVALLLNLATCWVKMENMDQASRVRSHTTAPLGAEAVLDHLLFSSPFLSFSTSFNHVVY